MDLWIFILVSLLVVHVCIAETLVVKHDGSGDYATIQAAIDAASHGGVIELLPGTYSGVGNRDLDFKGKSITVRSLAPTNSAIVASTIINCEGSAAEPHRGFVFENGESASSIVSGLTITNGYAVDSGGAIRAVGASPTISDCYIIGNTASSLASGGGGFYGLSCNSMISNCSFIDNVAYGSGDVITGAGNGGAIHGGAIRGSTGYSNLIVTNSTFIGNSAYRGGAMRYVNGAIENCVLVDNSATYGGGIHHSPGEITGSIITGNSAVQAGGLDACQGNITNTIIVGNYASDRAGGYGWCHNTVTNSIIAGNASRRGGGIYDSNTDIRNSVISGNSATQSGGGIDFQYDFHMTVANSIITNNTSPVGPQIALAPHMDGFSPEISVSYSNVEGGEAGVFVDTVRGASLDWGLGNMQDAPLFVGGELGTWTTAGIYDSNTGQMILTDTSGANPWVDGELVGKFINPDTSEPLQFLIVANTEDTITIWSGASAAMAGDAYQIFDYHLSSLSACIDAGDNSEVTPDTNDLDNDNSTTEPTPWDLDGNARFDDNSLVLDTGNGTAPLVDMGAYETPEPTTLLILSWGGLFLLRNRRVKG